MAVSISVTDTNEIATLSIDARDDVHFQANLNQLKKPDKLKKLIFKRMDFFA